MGIARALERVKRQAKRGGLQGVISGLGRELRSEQIPVPLRAAAQRIAALLPFEHVAVEHTGSGVRAGVVTHADDLVVAAPPRDVANDAPAHMSAVVDSAVVNESGPREGASATGSDAGVEPGPIEPEVGTPVDPESVGATPEVNASPLEVEPVDASPVDVRSTDATPVKVSPLAANPIVSQLAPDDVSVATSSDLEEPEGAAAAAGEKTPEELALNEEEAKNLARSGSRSKKRSRSKGTTSKKK